MAGAIPDVAGGPGWVIRAADLRPAITDRALFRAGMEGDPLGDAIESLWSGDPAAAERRLATAEPTLRVRALLADCHRDLGDVQRAVREYDALVAETRGTPHEAVMLQHRGKALLAADELERAVSDPSRARDLRWSAGADAGLRASTEQALAVARSRSRGS